MADSQKFIARNRAPRVQIEYDVELYGSQKKVQLPFVMGVMSDLSGKSLAPQPALEDRRFLEIDADNFDDRMRAMQPRAVFSVPNTLTGEGDLPVELTFESMDDFSPAAIARRIAPLRDLLEARTRLSNLMAYMDGKSGAEALLERILSDRALLEALAGARAPGGDEGPDADTVLAGLRDTRPDDAPRSDRTDDILSALRAAAPDDTPAADDTARVLAALADAAPDDRAGEAADRLGDALASLENAAPDLPQPDAGIDDILSGIDRVVAEPEADTLDETLQALAAAAPAEQADDGDDVDDTLAALAERAPDDAPGADDTPQQDDPTDDILAGIEPAADGPEPDGLDAALDALAGVTPGETDREDASDDVSADLADWVQTEDMADADDLDDVLAGIEADDGKEPLEITQAVDAGDDPGDADRDAAHGETADLDALLDELGGDEPVRDEGAPEAGDDLDALLGDLGVEGDMPDVGGEDDTGGDVPGGDEDLDALLAGLGDDEGGDDSDTGPGVDAPGASDDQARAGAAKLASDGDFNFGTVSADRPESARLHRKRFRIAILGDFSGRAARGQVDIGDDLASRRAIALDPDTVEEVIEGFATTLVLPIGKDGAGIEVRLESLDDLHPDELYEKVEIFSALAALKAQLGAGATAQGAQARLQQWADAHGLPVAPMRSRSFGSSVPADRRLSDFQHLIGDSENRLATVSPIDDLLARIVGPHVRAAPDADATALQAAIDEALSAAMRLVLHHPEFQTVESLWRSLDLIARRIETDDMLDVVLYDVSAEEIAADLAAVDDLAQTGLLRLLTEEPLDEETGRGGYSALIGLYTFEETPPHAELLGRIGRVAAHLDAPFFTAISPAFLETDKKDRHPLVARAWDRLRAMPEAGHLGIVTPRFLLRRPYGARSEPIYEFAFEEFTPREGLSGMLWANPAVLVAILLAQSFRQHGPAMSLGSVMSLGEMPYHYVNDRYGDQVALPCTERNLTTSKVEAAIARGFMPVISMKGRDVIRLGSFQSLAGAEILGPWTGVAPPPPSPPGPGAPDPDVALVASGAGRDDDADVPEDDDPGAGLDDASDDLVGADDDDPLAGLLDDDGDGGDDLGGGDADDDIDADLDALLAGFGDDGDEDENDDAGSDDMDAELAALLEDL